MRFAGKTILITGAASGIGRGIAELAAREGAARLILTDLRKADDFESGCVVDWLIGNVADEALWASAELGEIDHAVINAGVAGASGITDLDFSEWRRILSVNLDGAFLTLRAALRAMRDGGSIVAVASAAGIKAEPGIAAYAASKAGLIQLAKVAAKEAASHRIRVNAIAPGGVETPIWYGVPMFADRVKQVGQDAAFAEMGAMATPLGRYAKTEEIAEQIAFLLSNATATMTGAVLVTDGGYSL
jgi:NAD(P)-dependent dehydrogenase (short-subunit alcohol dehydrogenase family)